MQSPHSGSSHGAGVSHRAHRQGWVSEARERYSWSSACFPTPVPHSWQSGRPAQGKGRTVELGILLSGLLRDSVRPSPTRSPWEAGLGGGRGLAPGNASGCCAWCTTDPFLLLPARAPSIPGSSPGPPASGCWCDQTCQASSSAVLAAPGSRSHKPKLKRKPKPNRYKERKVMARGRRLWGARSTGRRLRPHPQHHSGASSGPTGSAPGPGGGGGVSGILDCFYSHHSRGEPWG